MTRSFHPPLYKALAASLLAFLLANIITSRTAHSAMNINLCNHSGPDFEKIAARFKEELKPGEKIKPALKRLNLSPGLGDDHLSSQAPLGAESSRKKDFSISNLLESKVKKSNAKMNNEKRIRYGFEHVHTLS